MPRAHAATGAGERVQEALESATAAKKCHACGCFQDAVAALDASSLAEPLAKPLAAARGTFEERRYDCLGCSVCWPADALNAAAELVPLPRAGCADTLPERRQGWPPFPGDYRVLRFNAPVAVCTLHSLGLVAEVAALAPEGLSVVGSLRTENLGIERVIENVVANPNIRYLLVCGEDTAGSIGHFPGQSLLALFESGIDDRRRIVNARGKRPLLNNVPPLLVERFRRQLEVLDRRGVTAAAEVAAMVDGVALGAPGPFDEPGLPQAPRDVKVIPAAPPPPLVLDPAGYVVIYPDLPRGMLVAEHYENRGTLRTAVEGAQAVDVMATLLREGLVTRLDHAAYLGRELARAELALRGVGRYVQDQAPDAPDAACGSSGASCSCA